MLRIVLLCSSMKSIVRMGDLFRDVVELLVPSALLGSLEKLFDVDDDLPRISIQSAAGRRDDVVHASREC